MNSKIKFVGLALVAFAFCATTAQAKALELQPGSTLALSGDSTLHPFISTATLLQLSAEADLSSQADGIKALLENKALTTWELVIPVKGLKSKDAGLDKNLYKALKAEEFPEIRFTMTGYEVSKSTGTPGAYLVKASGVLSISGKEQPIVLAIEATRDSATLRARGHYTLLMTDYGIKPPSLMMGAIKVRNPITIQFDLHVR